MIWEILEEKRGTRRGWPDRKASDNVAIPAGAPAQSSRMWSARNAWRCAILWSGFESTPQGNLHLRWSTGLSPTSQPLMNWKLRAFAANRRDFDRNALRMESDPPPVVPAIPKYPGLGQESAVRAAALMLKARAEDADLVVPDGQRDRYEAAFARLSSVFPDAFYIRERGRFYPDDSEDKGRLLSAGYHNVMGYFRDDTPLMELILDDSGKKELNRLWDEFDYIADFTARTWVQYYFNQSGEVQGKGANPGRRGLRIRKSARRRSSLDCGTPTWPRQRRATIRSRWRPSAITSSGSTTRSGRWSKCGWRRNRSHLRGSSQICSARLPSAAIAVGTRARCWPTTESLREKSGLTHEEAIRDSIVSVLMSPKFCYRIDLSTGTQGRGASADIVRANNARARGQSHLQASTAHSFAASTKSAGRNEGTGAREPLSGYALASRLSYFLWSSMPDDELLRLAASGTLQKPGVLIAQARRMLKTTCTRPGDRVRRQLARLPPFRGTQRRRS